MKKVLLSLFALCSFGAFAQADVAITLDAPAAGSTLGPGQAFDFDVTITNLGSVDITASDTVVYAPALNGSLLTSGNPPQNIVYDFTGTTIAAGGGTETRSHSFTGLNISGASAMQVDFCGLVAVLGPNWTGVTESDTTNNESCNTVNYDPNSVSIGEHVMSASLQREALDNSFYANGIYTLEVSNLESGAAEINVISITGQTMLSTVKEIQNHELKGSLELESLSKGVYIVSITLEGNRISAKKIVVQ